MKNHRLLPLKNQLKPFVTLEIQNIFMSSSGKEKKKKKVPDYQMWKLPGSI